MAWAVDADPGVPVGTGGSMDLGDLVIVLAVALACLAWSRWGWGD